MSHAAKFEMELRCPDCASPEVALIDGGTRLECGNCGSEFVREEAFVSVADAEAYAAENRACTCDKVRGCPQCFQRADDMIGSRIRDSFDAEWIVEDVDERDGFPTVVGTDYWAWVHDVTILKPAESDLRCDGEVPDGAKK